MEDQMIRSTKFVITCKTCGSTNTIFENELRDSYEDGMWGYVSIDCLNCHAQEVIIDKP